MARWIMRTVERYSPFILYKCTNCLHEIAEYQGHQPSGRCIWCGSVNIEEETNMSSDRFNKLTEEQMKELPIWVLERVYEFLKVYPECAIRYDNGDYVVSPGFGSYASVHKDYRVIGKVTRDQFYDEDEIMLNYVEQTHDYPDNYTGERVDLSNYPWNIKFKFDDNGNIVKE